MLAITLVVPLLVGLGGLVATHRLAKKHGLRLKSISISPIHGYTAEFFEPEEPQSGTTEYATHSDGPHKVMTRRSRRAVAGSGEA